MSNCVCKTIYKDCAGGKLESVRDYRICSVLIMRRKDNVSICMNLSLSKEQVILRVVSSLTISDFEILPIYVSSNI